ncbi:MAG: DUF922 domain-containing protein [Chloroflexi bacterium]|nr:DUF922 domain-containing protein [Chloroflexota bacterium]
MNLSNRALAAFIAFLLIACCLTGTAFVVVLGTTLDSPFELAWFAPTPTRTPTVTPTATATRVPPTATRTPAPTSTPVVRIPTVPATPARVQSPTRAALPTRAPTLAANPYNIIVPTPTAPSVVNPVTFESTFRVVTYSVTGKTTNELSRALDVKAIADPHEPNSRYYAMTEWFVSSDWQWQSSARGCELERANVSVTITMTLPALATRQGIASDLLTRWDTFIANTITHEKGHVTRALNGSREYQRALGNLATQSTCLTMRPTLDNLFKQNLDAIDRVNVQYDVETDHGATQGAVFP